MKNLRNNFCQIVCTRESDFNIIENEYKDYQIFTTIIDDLNIEFEHSIPTLIIGWSFIKEKNNKLKISQKQISKNLYWTFSSEEDKKTFEEDILIFLNQAIKEFLPKNYRSFDCILDGNISEKIEEIVNNQISFCYFEHNCLYIYNKSNFVGINLESINYTFEKKEFLYEKLSKIDELIFFNYDNLPYFFKKYNLNLKTLENTAWICNGQLITETLLHKFLPFPINSKYYVFFMHKIYEIFNCELINNKTIERYSKKDFLTNWLSDQEIHFDDNKIYKLKYSNKRTITGRINCNDKKFNPQLLPKNSIIRKNIISRFKGGKICVFDYVAFETKLSLYLTKNENFIKKLENTDLHKETSKIIFKKENISASERKIGKNINHAIIYGVGDEKLRSILIENQLNVELIKDIKKFLEPILKNSKNITEEYKKNGFIKNPYDSIIHPQKEWAVYNNYVQSIAADLVVEKLLKIKKFLESKKSKFMYQVYDSFIFDISPDEISIIKEIKNILTNNGKYSFDVEYVIGNNLMDCTNQNKEEEIEQLI